MAGLLDIATGDWTEDPNQNAAIRQGLLAAAFGALAGRGNRMQAIGQGGLTGLMGYANTLNAQDKRAAEAQARQQRDLELQDLRDRLARQQAMQALPQQFYRSPEQTALAGGGGPTVENAQRIDMAGPSFDYEGYAKALAQYDPVGSIGLQSSLRKTEAPVKLGAGESLIDPKTYRPLVTNPKADEQPSSVREYNFAVGQGYKGSFDQWKKDNAKAGASNITLNADKGFSGAFGKNVADAFQASQEQAAAAQSSNATIADIRQALTAGGVILGPGASARQTGLRIGQMLGVGGDGSSESLARTRIVEQGLANIELAAAQLMKGQGQVTEAERGIIKRAAAGDIGTLTPRELDVALQAIERNNNAKIALHAQRAKTMQTNPAIGSLGGMIDAPQVPPINQQPVRRYNPSTGKIE